MHVKAQKQILDYYHRKHIMLIKAYRNCIDEPNGACELQGHEPAI